MGDPNMDDTREAPTEPSNNSQNGQNKTWMEIGGGKLKIVDIVEA